TLSPTRLRRAQPNHKSQRSPRSRDKRPSLAGRPPMSVLELESLARKHWTKWLPEKVKELKAENQYPEAVHAAAVKAQEEIEDRMSQGYSIDEARDVALPMFIHLK